MSQCLCVHSLTECLTLFTPLQAPQQNHITVASQLVTCQRERLSGPGSGVPTSPWRNSWSSSWSRAPRPRTASIAWRSSACRQRTAGERPSTPGSCTCFRCSVRCSPASPQSDPALRPLPPRLSLPPALRSSPLPPCRTPAARPVISGAPRPRQTVRPSRANH